MLTETAKATVAAPRDQRGWQTLVGTVGGVFLGAVFMVAVWGKMFDPAAFAEVIRIEGVDFILSAEIVAPLALAVEAFVGLCLAFGIRRLWNLVPTAALVAFFLFLTGRTYLRYVQGIQPEMVSCGCFGHLVERTPAEAFWQDALLMVPPLVMAFFGRQRGYPVVPPVRGALVALLTAGILAFAWMAPDLPLDDLATRLSPGVRAEDICAGGGGDRICLTDEELAWWLTEGEYVVVIAALDDEDFIQNVAKRLDEFLEFTASPEAPRILVLFSGSKDDVGSFKMRSRAPPFEYQVAPQSMLRPLYRRLPRTFLVKDGMVTNTYDGLPKLAKIRK